MQKRLSFRYPGKEHIQRETQYEDSEFDIYYLQALLYTLQVLEIF